MVLTAVNRIDILCKNPAPSHRGGAECTFGSYLQKIQPDFDSRIYGYKKLSDLVRGRPDLFMTEERAAPSSNYKVLYVRAIAGI